MKVKGEDWVALLRVDPRGAGKRRALGYFTHGKEAAIAASI